MSRNFSDDELFQRIALNSDPVEIPAPSSLKAKIYSALTRKQAEKGPLLSLPETKAVGHALCAFEELVCIAPVGESARCANICRVCHARALAEHFDNPPIYWPGCPYVQFKKT